MNVLIADDSELIPMDFILFDSTIKFKKISDAVSFIKHEISNIIRSSLIKYCSHFIGSKRISESESHLVTVNTP